MKLSINLATKRYVDLPQLNVLLLLGFVLFGALALFKVQEIGHNQGELARLKSLSQAVGARAAGVQLSEKQLKAQESRIHFANAAIEKKSVNWLNLLDRLEEVVPAGVTLTQIEPDRLQGLRITGAAHGFANLRALLENMERSKNFSEVYLLSQSDTKVGLTQEGIQFNISCKVALQ